MADRIRQASCCAQQSLAAVATCLALLGCGGGGGDGGSAGGAASSASDHGAQTPGGSGYIKRHEASEDWSFGRALTMSPAADVMAVSQASALSLFTRDAEQWTWAQTLSFGERDAPTPALARDGSLIVGLPGADHSASDAGQVQVFQRTPTGWVLSDVWPAPTPAAHGHFGGAVSLSADGTVAVVGEPGDFTPGRFHVYRRHAGRWSLHQSVAPVFPQRGSRFGAQARLSADGGTIVVGAPQDNSGSTSSPSDTSLSNAGSAFVYGFDAASNAWRLRAYLKAPTPMAHDGFGSATAVSGDGATVVIGARFRSVSGKPGAGVAYVYRRGTGGYARSQTITSPQLQTKAHFGGHALVLTPDASMLAIGEIGDAGRGKGADADPTPDGLTWAGATHLYRLQGGQYVHRRFLKASNTGQGDMFGWSIALAADGSRIAVGAPAEGSDSTGFGGDQADNNVVHRGAVYLY